MKSNKRKWRLLDIDAWAEDEGGWTWNDVHVLSKFECNADANMKRMLLKKLREARGNTLPRGMYYVHDEDWCLEVRQRKNHRPVFAIQSCD